MTVCFVVGWLVFFFILPHADVDECIGRSDCEQVCINTVGSYDCDCFDGFTFNSGTSACDGMGSISYFIIMKKICS